jgi:hypothetical protein
MSRDDPAIADEGVPTMVICGSSRGRIGVMAGARKFFLYYDTNFVDFAAPGSLATGC